MIARAGEGGMDEAKRQIAGFGVIDLLVVIATVLLVVWIALGEFPRYRQHTGPRSSPSPAAPPGS